MSVVAVVIAVVAAAEAVQLAGVALVLRRLRQQIFTLLEAARTDELTGLRSRRGLLADWRHLARARRPPAVLLVDLLQFKDINDQWGHDAGDELLAAVGERLAAVAAALGAAVGRLGGDEFVLLLRHKAHLIEAAAAVQDALAKPLLLDLIGEPLTVACVIGLAAGDAQPLPGKPFRAADIAHYHAREHRQPYAVYRPGMTHPQAEQRFGQRLRDRRPLAAVAVFDEALFHRLVAGQVSDDIAHRDDIEALGELLEVLDPRSRDFGTDVRHLVDVCLTHHVLRLSAPVTGIEVSPTTAGEYRDGGFLVLVDIADAVTLSCGPTTPRLFTDDPAQAPVLVMTHVAQLINRHHDAYRATGAGWRLR